MRSPQGLLIWSFWPNRLFYLLPRSLFYLSLRFYNFLSPKWQSATWEILKHFLQRNRMLVEFYIHPSKWGHLSMRAAAIKRSPYANHLNYLVFLKTILDTTIIILQSLHIHTHIHTPLRLSQLMKIQIWGLLWSETSHSTISFLRWKSSLYSSGTKV